MKRLNKIMSAVLAVVMVLSLVPMMSFAATMSMDGYLFVPVKTGKEAAALFSNSEGVAALPDGADATISTDPMGSVSIEFQPLVSGAERTRTDVMVDMSCVEDHYARYVKFDMTTDSLMDLVMTMDPIDAGDQDWDNRPHSIYLFNEGWLSVTMHPQKNKFITKDQRDGYLSAVTGDWWVKDTKNTIPFEAEKTYEVVFILDSTIAPSSESDMVSVYIDGRRVGQTKINQRIDAYLNCKLGIHHYATATSTQNLYLDNVEVGFCEKNHIAPTKTLDVNATEWEIPAGKNTFVQLTLPTTSEYAWNITADTVGRSLGCNWYKDFGALIDRDTTGFKADGTSTDGYSNIYSWRNKHLWKDTDEITVTVEVNEIFKSYEVYTNKGNKSKFYYGTRPTKVILNKIVGDVKPTSVISGDVVYKTLSFEDATGAKKESFLPGDEIYLRAYRATAPNKDLLAICAYYDVNGNLIAAYDGKAKADKDGRYAISDSYKIGGKAPENAKTLKAYIWDSLTKQPIIQTMDIKNPEILGARLLGRTEVYNGGYSLNWPNSGIEFTFEGTEAAVEVIDVTAGYGDKVGDNYFNVYVDGIELPERLVINEKGWHTIVSGLDNKKHTVKMVRSSEAKDSRLWISDVKANNLAPTEAKDRLIEFYGDSYAAGYGNLGVQEGSRFTWGVAENSDAQRAYPYLVAENFNADLNVIAYSGKGMIWNSTKDEGIDIRELSAYSDVLVNDDTRTPSTWDHSKQIPDLVVIFLGTNDAGYANGTAEGFKEAYIGFVGTLRERYGDDTKILCVGTPEKGYTEEVEAVANELKASDRNVEFFRFEKFGTSSIYAHPNVAEAAASAEELKPVIAEFMGW